ncbi:MAG: exopolysaccharide transport family protein [Mucilaginibacter sp.]
MELGGYFSLLYRHRFTLIIVPILTVIITYFLVRNQPDSYTSESQIATGIVDKTQQALSDNTATGPGEAQVAQDFDNLIEILRSKKMLDQVSYQLIIHDLTSNEPFRKPCKLLDQMNRSAREHALAVYTDLYNNRKGLSLYNSDQAGLNNLLVCMKYDDESLLKKLIIYRAQNSDFINVDFSADNPQLTAFVVNTLSHEFITYYNFVIKDNQRKAMNFLGTLAQSKRDTLDKKINQLKNYKIRNGILSIPEQSRALYSQLGNLETHLTQERELAAANDAAVRNIDKQFNPGEHKYLESEISPINQRLINLKDEYTDLYNTYIQSDFDDAYKPTLDSLQHKISSAIIESADKNSYSPLSYKQNLVEQRLTLETARDLAKNSIGAIEEGIQRTNAQLNTIVPHEAVVQQDESDINVAQQEYLEILNKYNQTSLDANYVAQPKQTEVAMPGIAEPSKKMLLVILSGIITFVFCLVVFFVLYFFDENIKTPEELADKTNVPVLGYLNLLSSSTIDLRRVWTDSRIDEETYHFRNLLQSIRFEVDSEMKGSKILLVDSLMNGEGKTFLSTNLAYAYSLVNKKVLLIDGNFGNPSITRSVKSKIYVEDYLTGSIPGFASQSSYKITVLSNKGGDISLFEVANEKLIREKIEKLKNAFDIIIIEASALSTLNKSKEWNRFADKILCVFEANKKIKNSQQANIEYLKSLDGKFIGWVLNVVNKFNAAADVAES